MCGIFGGASNSPNNLNGDKIKILGMFNESRGKQSCGITLDNNVYHGMDNTKLFTDFAKNKSFQPKENSIIIGHTRQSSSGAINNFNCHPFTFDNIEGSKMIAVHNGTLYNHTELAKKYEINMTQEYLNTYNQKILRTKIDSEILLEILYKTRNFKVLSEYIGRAALIWTDLCDPTKLYMWSGSSTADKNTKGQKELEERPMNVYIHNDNTFYFSSLPESLEVISENNSKIFQIDYNTVYIVTNGDFKNAEKHIVSRKDACHTEQYYSYTNAYSQNRKTYHQYSDIWDDSYLPVISNDCNIDIFKNQKSSINIFDDISTKFQDKNKVQTKKLRHYNQNELITGVYVDIPNFGYLKVGINKELAIDFYNNRKNKFFKDGLFYDVNIDTTSKIVFTEKEPKLFYFINGALIKTELDYNMFYRTRDLLTNMEMFSWITEYPIFSIESRQPDTNQNIFKDGKLFTGTIDYEYFEKIYVIEKGNLISTSPQKEKVKISNKEKLIILENKLLEHEKNICKNEKIEFKKYNENDDFLEITKILDTHISSIPIQINNSIGKLEKLKKSFYTSECINMLDDVLSTVNILLEL